METLTGRSDKVSLLENQIEKVASNSVNNELRFKTNKAQ